MKNSSQWLFNILLGLPYLIAITGMLKLFIYYIMRGYIPAYNLFLLLAPLSLLVFTIKDLKIRKIVSLVVYFSPLLATLLSINFIIDDNILAWMFIGPVLIALGLPFLIWKNLREEQKKKTPYIPTIVAWIILILVFKSSFFRDLVL